MNGREIFEREEYNINTITTEGAKGFCAVFKCDNDDGSISLRLQPADALGVAECTVIRYHGQTREVQSRRVMPRRVVLLEFTPDSGFMILDEYANCIGYARAGDDIAVVAKLLLFGDNLKRLKQDG